MILKKIVITILFIVIPPLTNTHAYTDELVVPVEEAWRAVLDTLGPKGVHKADEKESEIVSTWIEDSVRRSRGFFANIFRQTVYRRYRLKIKFTKTDLGTQVGIAGHFQERMRGAGPSIPWKNILRPQSEDYQAERDFFLKMMKQLEENRLAGGSIEKRVVGEEVVLPGKA